MVERHFCLLNPASSAKAPRQTVSEGKTPEMPRKDAERLIRSIDVSNVVGLRDRAVNAVMIATGCRVGAVAKLRVKHFFHHDGQWHLWLDEKNRNDRTVPVRHDLQGFILAYTEAAGLTVDNGAEPLFRTVAGRTKKLTAYTPRSRTPWAVKSKRNAVP